MGQAVHGCDSIVLRTAVHATHESDRIMVGCALVCSVSTGPEWGRVGYGMGPGPGI